MKNINNGYSVAVTSHRFDEQLEFENGLWQWVLWLGAGAIAALEVLIIIIALDAMMLQYDKVIE